MVLSDPSTDDAQFTSGYLEIACSTRGGLMLKFSFYHTTYLDVLSLEVDCAFMGCLNGMSFTSVGFVNCITLNFK